MTLLYEDGAVSAFLKSDGVAIGHVEVKPKESVKYLEQLDPEVVEQLWYCASFAATAVFEGLGAQGTNMLLVEGEDVAIHVLPRMMDDGLNLQWEAKRADPSDLSGVSKQLSDAFWPIGKKELSVEEKQEVPVREQELSEPVEQKDASTDYRIKQLQRRL